MEMKTKTMQEKAVRKLQTSKTKNISWPTKYKSKRRRR